MADDAFMRGWLQAFFDGEGWATFHFSVRKSGKHVGHKTRTIDVCVGNTDVALMDRCSEFLSALGVPFRKMTIEIRSGKPFYRIHIASRAGVLAFHREVGFHAPSKAEKLEAMVRWHNRPSRRRSSTE